MTPKLRLIEFEGDSREVLAHFPESVRFDLGYQLFRIQEGKEPYDWKPFKSVGSGCREIRVWDQSGTYRAIYVLIVSDTVHVLHVFQKKSEKTALREVAIARERFRSLKGRIEDGKRGKI